MEERILVVDDEKEIADLIELYLKNEGYLVSKFYSGSDAMEYLKFNDISLAVLDVMLPDIDGFTMCQQIREEHYFPILMLTARVEEIDIITGLTLGADDYITKPFNPLELIARVKTQLRRYKRYNKTDIDDDSGEVDIRGLHIDESSYKCSLNGKELDLTKTEFKIITYLAKNQGRVIPSEELFECVWGEKFMDNNNTVMAHIARIREKMNEIPRKPRYIKTVWGVGYTIE